VAATFFILKAGIAPPDLKNYPDHVRVLFWQWVTELGLKRKDYELARGLNAYGEPLPGVLPATRKHRRSEMTPTGKGDPSAPYLMPGRRLSRTRSLLTGKAHADYAEFFWRYDAHTGDQWGKVLAVHASRGRAYNVVGLSPAGVAAVAREAQRRWRQWLLGSPVPPGVVGGGRPAAGVPRFPAAPHGQTDLTHATFGIGATREQAQRAIDEGRSSGGRTQAEWQRYWRQRAAAIPHASAPSVRVGSSNVLLQHVHAARAAVNIEAAINNLLASIEAGYTREQIEAVLGDQFERALAEAWRRGVVEIVKGRDGRFMLRVVR
jgi:hypothetical protein